MDIQHIKIRIGIVCVGFLIATVILVMLFGGGKIRLFRSDYEVYVLLQQAPMLSENSPVYKNGVEIGRVTRVELVNDDREVQITVRIDGNIKLYTSDECNLSLNLLGQSTLNFTPKADLELGDVLPPKCTIRGVKPIDLTVFATAMQDEATTTLRSVRGVADAMKNSLDVLNRVIGSPDEVAQKQKRLEEMVARADEIMSLIGSVLGSVNELISDEDIKAGIKISSAQLPGLIEEGKNLMANVNGMTEQIAPLLRRVDNTISKVDSNLDNIGTFTAALGDNGPQIAEALANAAQEFERSLAHLAEFVQSLNNPDSTIGQLLNDPEFYQTLNSTMKNADQTIKNIQRITVQLQPIIQDVNVISNKIAREPALLGLKGVFDRSPPTKGIPDAYANPWLPGRNNGIPQQQSERIQLLRLPHWPMGPMQYRNEPVPLQNRYASQVIDLPDSIYDDGGYGYNYSPSGELYYETPPTEPVVYPYPVSQLVPQSAPLNRVVIVPMQASDSRLQTSGIEYQEQVSGNVVNTNPEARNMKPEVMVEARSPKPEDLNTMTLELDFTPNPSHTPLRLASGSVSMSPPIIQPLHGITEQAAPQVIQTSGFSEMYQMPIKVSEPQSPKSIVPDFTPTF